MAAEKLLTGDAQKLHGLESHLRALIDQYLAQGLLQIDDVIVITYTLGKAQTSDELRMAILKIGDQYPILKDALSIEAEQDKENIQYSMQAFVEELLVKDPVQAAALSQKTLEKDVTLEKLFEASPEFKVFYFAHKPESA